MQVTITSEYRFFQKADGTVWTQTAFPYSFWQRYLSAFDSVTVAARIQPVHTESTAWQRADGLAVAFHPLPYYVGPLQYMQNFAHVRKVARQAANAAGAFIMRVPSNLATAIYPPLKQRNQPFGLEIVGDPFDVFAPGTLRHPLRPLFRWWFVRQLQGQCKQASAAAYVTEEALQRRYPTQETAYTTHYSSIELPDEAFVQGARDPQTLYQDSPKIQLIFVGTFEQLYKAPDVLLQALGHGVAKGLNLHLTMIGDGKHRQEVEALCASLGLSNRVAFIGQVPSGAAIREQLDKADLFVLPSRTEGLPRAMIEAMSRALPCIGTQVGGMPELLPADDLVPPNDAVALAKKIQQVVTNPARMAAMSARNLAKSRHYAETVLAARRNEFYRCVRDNTQEWLAHQK